MIEQALYMTFGANRQPSPPYVEDETCWRLDVRPKANISYTPSYNSGGSWLLGCKRRITIQPIAQEWPSCEQQDIS